MRECLVGVESEQVAVLFTDAFGFLWRCLTHLSGGSVLCDYDNLASTVLPLVNIAVFHD